MLCVFDLETLLDFKGGLVNRMLKAQTNRVALDLESAPDVGEWRKVNVAFRWKPVIEDGELGDVVFECEVSGRMPARCTSARMRVKKETNGAKQLFFEMDAPDNPDQLSLLDDQTEVKPVKGDRR